MSEVSLAYWIVGAAIVLGVLFKLVQRKDSAIPYVKGGLPFFGQMFIMLKGSPWDTMAKWVLEYGTVYRIQLFGSECTIVSDPALLKVVLQTKMNTFKKDIEWTYKPFLVLLGNGLVTSDGDSWRKQRTLLANHLKFNILDEIPNMAMKAVQRLCVKLDKAKATGEVVEMAEEFRTMTLQVIAEAVLSLSPEESDSTFAHMYLPIVYEGNLRTWNPERMYFPTPSWFKFRRDVATLNNYVTGLIEKRWALRQKEAQEEKASGVPTTRVQDVLDKSLGAVLPEEWCPEVVQQIRDEVKTFILAGHETSASMLAWALYELSISSSSSSSGKPSDMMQRMQEEAKSVFTPDCYDPKTGKICKMPPRSVLDKLVFSECCLRESLRKYSVVPTVVRICSQDVEMEQYKLQKGSTIMVNMQGVHHNPTFWPEPLVYKPDRFLEPVVPYTFLPFVEGPRMCLGQYLSLLESKIVLALLLSNYRFEVTNPEDAGLKHAFMVPIIPKTGHFMKVY
jgi:cytochrome P450